MKKKNILVIGAGPAGLAFIYSAYKNLSKDNYTLTCYEKNDKIGGIWSNEAKSIKINDLMHYENFGRSIGGECFQTRINFEYIHNTPVLCQDKDGNN